jgi:indolepyruvate ferredoxin oxidoreductase alpha subunit
MGEPTYAINIYNLCKAMGIDNVVEVDSFNQDELTRVIKEETARDAVSVVICKAPCALLKGQTFPYKCRPIPEKCMKCGACLRPGCPAITKNSDGTIFINETMCNGCNLCAQMCKFNAIERTEK